MRFYPVVDSNGNLVTNTWLVVMDYENTEFDNSDFQDNVYLVSNMRPATQAPAPTDVQASSSGGSATLQWAPVSDASFIGYNVSRVSSISGPYTKLNSSPIGQTSFTDSNPGSGTWFYRVTAIDSAGESQGSNASAVVGQVQVQHDVLTSIDINATPAGSTTVITSGKDYNVTAGGADIGGSAADGFRFLYEQITGDFDAQAQVSSLTEVLSNTFAGVMARQTLDAGSPMIFSGASAADGYRFNYRTTADAVGTFNKYGTVSYSNVWVRLTRQGNVFTGYYSTDGSTWTQTGQLTLALPSTIDLGLAVASHSTTQTTTAELRNFGVIVPVSTITPKQKVANDKTTLAAARLKLKQDRKQLQLDLKAYRAALRALHKSPTDPTLMAAADAALATVTQDKTTIASDLTSIKTLQKQLKTDTIDYRKSLHHTKV